MGHADAFLGKAEESLASAEADFAAGRFNACARNAYYAAFQGSIAALLHEAINPRGRWDHEFVQAQFAGMLVYRRKRYPASMNRGLSDAFDLRVDADYYPINVGQRPVRRSLEFARTLIGLVREKVNGHS